MLKKLLFFLLIVFLLGCGGGSSRTNAEDSSTGGISTPSLTFDGIASGLSYTFNFLEFDGLLYTGENHSIGSYAYLDICCNLTAGSLWSTVDFSNFGGETFRGITSLVNYKNTLYIGMSGVAGRGKVLACNNKAGGGNPSYCDHVGDFVWTNNPIADDIVNYKNVWTMKEFNGYLYLGQGGGDYAGDIWMCDPTTAGNADLCDDASDWTKVHNSGGSDWGEIVQNMEVYKNRLYATHFWDDNQRVAILVCDPSGGTDPDKCDSGDWSSAFTRPNTPYYDGFTSIKAYNDCLYIGKSRSNQDGFADILKCCSTTCSSANNNADWSLVYDGAEQEVASMTVWNNQLFFGTGTTGAAGTHGNLYRLNPDNTATLLVDAWGGNQFSRVMALGVYNNDLFVGMSDASGGTWGADIYKIE